MINNRASGILLHISSLPSDYGVGDFGNNAYRFADFLKDTGTRYWQILPLNPTDAAMGHSPYSSSSAFAINPLFIDPEQLLAEGLLETKDLKRIERTSGKVNYGEASKHKTEILEKAYGNFRQSPMEATFHSFSEKHSYWLDDYALFVALKKHFGGEVWTGWPAEIRDRGDEALGIIRDKLSEEIGFERFVQFLAYRQWEKLHTYCNKNKVQLIGDIPIYVQFDSADVWSNPGYFKLDERKLPTHVAGVPPDYFSETGQLWGNPVYNWESLRNNDFSWWIKRLKHNFNLFDLARIDHFRGLIGYWEVPYGEVTAVNGEWVDVPVWDFYNEMQRQFSFLPVIAEDLGTITADVKEFLLKTRLPGMRVLQFGFMSEDPADNFLPHNYIENCVAYTGTHDNNTMRGWYREEVSDAQKDRLNKYMGKNINEANVSFEMIRRLMQSVAGIAIFQMQDLLNQDENFRMNTPSTANGNWAYSFSWNELSKDKIDFLRELNHIYNRS